MSTISYSSVLLRNLSHMRKMNISASSFLSNHNNFAHEFELQPQGVPGLIDVMDTPRVYAEGVSGVCNSYS